MLVYASVPKCILPVYAQYTLNTLEFDLGKFFLKKGICLQKGGGR